MEVHCTELVQLAEGVWVGGGGEEGGGGMQFPYHPTNQGLSYKMDLDFWDCFGRGKHIVHHNCTQVLYGRYRYLIILEGKNLSYSHIIMIINSI